MAKNKHITGKTSIIIRDTADLRPPKFALDALRAKKITLPTHWFTSSDDLEDRPSWWGGYTDKHLITVVAVTGKVIIQIMKPCRKNLTAYGETGR